MLTPEPTYLAPRRRRTGRRAAAAAAAQQSGFGVTGTISTLPSSAYPAPPHINSCSANLSTRQASRSQGFGLKLKVKASHWKYTLHPSSIAASPPTQAQCASAVRHH
ncbi:hypothetical protein BJ912DRAFT_1065548 [Pholiota molesta]|nr:hypothetical protein BJ912DRAFT_1065548 [Pholiota molesta]